MLSGAYGTTENRLEDRYRKLSGGSKGRYILRRLFPPASRYRAEYPWAYRHRILLPAAWVLRLAQSLKRRSGDLVQEIRFLIRK